MNFETMRWEVPGGRLLELERKEKDLERAKKLIARLRASNKSLRAEHFAAYSRMEDRLSRLTGHAHRYGAKIVMSIFRKSTV
jgi:hypothetical protein